MQINLFQGNLNTISSKTSKQTLQQKKPRYEPPTSKRAPPPTITTTSWRKNWPHHVRNYHRFYKLFIFLFIVSF